MAVKNLEKEEIRRIQIVEAAYEVIASKGYNNFTIEDIANQAGLSKGGVLHYFKTKEDILINLLERIHTVLEENIKIRSQKYKTTERKLKSIIITYVTAAKRNPAFYVVMVDFWAQIPVNDRIRHINNKIYELMYNEIKKAIDTGINEGIFNEVDSSNVAHAMTSMILNVAIQWTFNNSIYNINRMTKTCLNMLSVYLKKKKV